MDVGVEVFGEMVLWTDLGWDEKERAIVRAQGDFMQNL